jgi:hypothetical protein
MCEPPSWSGRLGESMNLFLLPGLLLKQIREFVVENASHTVFPLFTMLHDA